MNQPVMTSGASQEEGIDATLRKAARVMGEIDATLGWAEQALANVQQQMAELGIDPEMDIYAGLSPQEASVLATAVEIDIRELVQSVRTPGPQRSVKPRQLGRGFLA